MATPPSRSGLGWILSIGRHLGRSPTFMSRTPLGLQGTLVRESRTRLGPLSCRAPHWDCRLTDESVCPTLWGRRFRLPTNLQLISAPGAMRPACLDGAVAGPAGGLDTGTAARAERVAGLYAGAAAGTIYQQRIPQDEVEDDADAVEQEDGQQGPHHVAHTPAPGIAVDISDQQGIAGQHQRSQSRDD